MSTRRQPGTPPGRPPRRKSNQPDLKKYLLPAAGAAVVLLVVGLIIVALVAGDNGDDEDDDEVAAADPTGTVTGIVETPEATEESDAVMDSTPEATEVDEIVTPAPDTTPDESSDDSEPEPETETESTPASDPTPEPVVGDFGELPPGDMPSGSPAEALQLQYQLDMSLQNIPREAAAYQIQRREWTMDEVLALTDRLGIDGEVIDQGGGSFRSEGSTGSIYINSTTVQYIRASAEDAPPALPENEQLGQMARSWLTDNGLVSADVGPARVLDRNEEAGVAYVQVKPVEPADLISHTPSASVQIRGDGVVTEATINWPRSLSASTYGLRTAEDLWSSASQGRGFVEINVNDLPAGFQGAGGTVTITSAGIAYTIAGSPQGTQFLVPVVVFSGSATVDGADGPVPVRIFVEAVSAQASPRG